MIAPATDAALLIPEGTRLVHIGPFKTGTTSLQAAFHAGRAAMHEQGVHYTGPNAQPVGPVMAATGRAHVMFGEPPPIKAWRRLVREIEEAPEPRVVVSSEFFSDAPSEAIRRIVDDLDPSRVHVVVTLRPLARIIPSQWQQFVQGGLVTGFDDWLRTTLDVPADGSQPLFWQRHRHDQLIARWAEVVGTENLTVVVVDDRDHAMVLRVFERLIGLREGTLVTPPDRSNRSLSRPEVEAVRAFNTLARDEGIGRPLMAKVMRYGSTTYMKLRDPATEEAKVELPGWAADRATDVAREMVGAISGLGVRIVGDLDSLVQPSGSSAGRRSGSTSITPEVAASMIVGVVLASGLARGTATDPRALRVVSTAKIWAIFLRRVRVAVRSRRESLLRRLRPRPR